MTSVNDIRSTFLGYFADHGHQVVESSNLVPRNDPTLMFTNSGMVQFKNVFTGVEKRDYKRATTSQKCVRAGGKHNDLDNVGYTARHLTFFEMLGNFSFGDYFKDQAIPFAWELLTKGFGIDPDRLTVTVYHDDVDAATLWKKVAGLPEDRIIKIATNDNFWMMGPTGPCGPCSEIFYDHGPSMAGGPPGSPDQDGDRFVEIWNNVFMQFEQFADGRREALPKQSVDTGMGLERFGAVLQGKQDVFATDTLRALVEASANFTDGDADGAGRFHHRVIADHMRSTAFLIADGVMPSNEGRGYVLRRIMRRAMRHAHLLGAKDPVMHRLVPTLVAEMGQAFGELARAQTLIAETLLLEETRFLTTLDRGLKLLDAELADLTAGADLAGATAFRLYDTFGFPLDLTQDALREKGRGVDVAGFDLAMAAQKARARAAWAGTGEAADDRIWFELAEKHGVSEFLGYDTERAAGQVLALVMDGVSVAQAAKGDLVSVVLNQTPFYAESGGQVGDTGEIVAGSGTAKVSDTRKKAGVIVHLAEVMDGFLSVDSAAELQVDHARRTAIRANHSATHLLNEALRRNLGDHVAQRGSLNAPDRLRFDFAHNKGLTPAEFKTVQIEVNGFIRQNSLVQTRIMTPDAARAMGAQALFGEKYGDEVRVVSMGLSAGSGKGSDRQTYSLELCGGTHVGRTGEIGLCVLVGDSAVSSGIRRIEALTGNGALAYVEQQLGLLQAAAGAIKASVADLPERVARLVAENRAMNSEIADMRRQLAMSGGVKADEAAPKDINGVALVGKILQGVSGKDLRAMIDEHKARLGSGVVVLVADAEGKAAVAAGVTPDLSGRVSAVDLVRVAAEAMGGKGGGGRPDMAQGGAPDASRAEAALKAAEAWLARLGG